MKYDKWWLVVDEAEVDVCVTDPGSEVDLYVASDLDTMVEVWMGDLPLRQALARRQIELAGSRRLKADFPRWFRLSGFAGVADPPQPLDVGRILAAMDVAQQGRLLELSGTDSGGVSQ